MNHHKKELKRVLVEILKDEVSRLVITHKDRFYASELNRCLLFVKRCPLPKESEAHRGMKQVVDMLTTHKITWTQATEQTTGVAVFIPSAAWLKLAKRELA